MKREPDFYGTAKGESKGMVSHRSQREGVGLLLSFPLVHTKHCNVAVFSICIGMKFCCDTRVSGVQYFLKRVRALDSLYRKLPPPRRR